jgi:hypothetical protein
MMPVEPIGAIKEISMNRLLNRNPFTNICWMARTILDVSHGFSVR